MTRNVTLRIEEEILQECRYAAVAEDKSLSQWIVDRMTDAVQHRKDFRNARARAVKRLATGYRLGNVPFNRSELYER